MLADLSFCILIHSDERHNTFRKIEDVEAGIDMNLENLGMDYGTIAARGKVTFILHSITGPAPLEDHIVSAAEQVFKVFLR